MHDDFEVIAHERVKRGAVVTEHSQKAAAYKLKMHGVVKVIPMVSSEQSHNGIIEVNAVLIFMFAHFNLASEIPPHL